MMQLYPAHAAEALEFDKIKQLLLLKCRTDAARGRITNLRFQTKAEHIERALLQTSEFKQTLSGGETFPNDFTQNIDKELKLLTVVNAVLNGEQLLAVRNLALNMRDVLFWFKRHNELFPALRSIIENIQYEKEIAGTIEMVIDDAGQMRDTASKELSRLRTEIISKRQALRKLFESILRKLSKQGYLADISEDFLNSRRTVAINAEHKRIVKGILHGKSDSQRIVFIEPEETIELNNELFSLERAEAKEIHRTLLQTTASVAKYHSHLEQYHFVSGLYDFIRAKAMLAKDMDAQMPLLTAHSGISLCKAYHPLLLLHNKQNEKNTVPLNLILDRNNRILIISGPNTGGKTVAMKTAGLLQLMIQAGLLIPADEKSELGIFKQLMIHIGDTQSIEHELSTYSAHLRDMKYFMDFANGKTLFFIDELGSGSDPALGGAFAEAIVEELVRKNALGIITTHYLNLKVMAGKVKGIMNGAMGFDEEKLEPLYQLQTGKPGSSYTFAIAQRSKLPEKIIERAKQLTELGHFKLDKILQQTEQQATRLSEKEKQLNILLKENETLKKNYETLTDKEKLKQQSVILRLQNQVKQEELDYLRDTERKFKQIIQDWKKAEDKQSVIESAEKILFKKKHLHANAAMAKKVDKNYEPTGLSLRQGDTIRSKINHQVGKLIEIREKRAIVVIGQMPFNVNIEDWIAVRKKKK